MVFVFSRDRTPLSREMAGAVQWLAVSVAALVSLGLVMILSVTAAEGAADGSGPGGHLVLRLIWIGVGGAALYGASRVNLRWLEEQGLLLLGLAILSLAVVLLPWVGTATYGARRWIRLGPVGMQPSEFAKLLLLAFLAAYAAAHRGRLASFREGLLVPGLAVAAVCGLVFLEPDYGTAMLIGLVGLAVLLIAGASAWQVALAGSGALPLVGIMIWLSPGRWGRIVAFLHPEEHSSGAAYQMIQAGVALGSGGLLGRGAGAGGQKYGFLPQAGTDFIFAVVGEEFGVLGTGAVIALFALVVWSGMKIALSTKDTFASLLAAGVSLYIGAQAIIHIAVVTGCAPTKGIALPFISIGGSSLVTCMIGVGLLVAVARHASAECALARTGPSTSRRIERTGSGAVHGFS